jgi:hypothetical protein
MTWRWPGTPAEKTGGGRSLLCWVLPCAPLLLVICLEQAERRASADSFMLHVADGASLALAWDPLPTDCLPPQCKELR